MGTDVGMQWKLFLAGTNGTMLLFTEKGISISKGKLMEKTAHERITGVGIDVLSKRKHRIIINRTNAAPLMFDYRTNEDNDLISLMMLEYYEKGDIPYEYEALLREQSSKDETPKLVTLLVCLGAALAGLFLPLIDIASLIVAVRTKTKRYKTLRTVVCCVSAAVVLWGVIWFFYVLWTGIALIGSWITMFNFLMV